MKKSLVLAGLLLAGSSVMAMDSQWFIGVDASYSDLDAKLGFTGTAAIDGVDYSNLSTGVSDEDTALGLKAGVILHKDHRISLNYTEYDPSKHGVDLDLDVITLNYDYLFNMSDNFTPFIGVHLGQAEMETLGYDDTSLVHGLQGGVIYSVTNNVAVEFGLSYSRTDVKPTTPTASGSYGSLTLTNASAYVEAEDMTKAYVGLNYRF